MKKRMSESEARKETRAIWAMVIIIMVVVALALYGYLTGSWA
jgi:hypothetical protein